MLGATERLLHGLLISTILTVDVGHGLHAEQLALREELIAHRVLLHAHRRVRFDRNTRDEHVTVRSSAKLQITTVDRAPGSTATGPSGTACTTTRRTSDMTWSTLTLSRGGRLLIIGIHLSAKALSGHTDVTRRQAVFQSSLLSRRNSTIFSCGFSRALGRLDTCRTRTSRRHCHMITTAGRRRCYTCTHDHQSSPSSGVGTRKWSKMGVGCVRGGMNGGMDCGSSLKSSSSSLLPLSTTTTAVEGGGS